MPDVGHDDENKDHNYLSNVYWTEPLENNNKPGRKNKIRKPVYCIELNREFISISQAAKELGLTIGGISAVVTGRNKTCRGYHFRFV